MANSYDPKRVTLTWAGILLDGVMDGEFVSVEFQEDSVMLHVGTQGDTTFVENPNLIEIANVTLEQYSAANRKLSDAVDAKLKGAFLMKDLAGDTVVEAADTRIQKKTPIKRGKEIVGNEWKFLLPKCIATVGGNL